MVHPSLCSNERPGPGPGIYCPDHAWPDTYEFCGGRESQFDLEFFSVVGPGYPSIPAYCAHARSVPHYQYVNHTLGPKDCIKKCAKRSHFGYAGFLRSACYCGASQPGREWVVEESKCDVPCDGRDPVHDCGGEDVTVPSRWEVPPRPGNPGISVYKLNTTAESGTSPSTVGKDQLPFLQ